MEERVARFADIDTRRALGFPPRKLPPSDFKAPIGEPIMHYGREPSGTIRVEVKSGWKSTVIYFFDSHSMIKAHETGEIEWHFGLKTPDYRYYVHDRS